MWARRGKGDPTGTQHTALGQSLYRFSSAQLSFLFYVLHRKPLRQGDLGDGWVGAVGNRKLIPGSKRGFQSVFLEPAASGLLMST